MHSVYIFMYFVSIYPMRFLFPPFFNWVACQKIELAIELAWALNKELLIYIIPGNFLRTINKNKKTKGLLGNNKNKYVINKH